MRYWFSEYKRIAATFIRYSTYSHIEYMDSMLFFGGIWRYFLSLKIVLVNQSCEGEREREWGRGLFLYLNLIYLFSSQVAPIALFCSSLDWLNITGRHFLLSLFLKAHCVYDTSMLVDGNAGNVSLLGCIYIYSPSRPFTLSLSWQYWAIGLEE